MGELWVGLLFCVLSFYFTAKMLQASQAGHSLMAVLFLCLSLCCAACIVVPIVSLERHPPDPNALQNAQTAIIGKLRAELHECREWK